MAAYFELKQKTGAFWLLTDGIVTMLLRGLIYVGWSESSHWAVGTLVGLTILFNGVANLMFSLAARRILASRKAIKQSESATFGAMLERGTRFHRAAPIANQIP